MGCRMSLESLLKVVPPQAIYRRIPLDPRLNALGSWHEAANSFVVPSDDNGVWTALVYASQISSLRLLPAHRTFALGVLERNAECLAAIDRGLQRGQLQFAELRSLEQAPAETEFASRLGEISRLHLIRFRLAYAEGDLGAAADELFRLEKIGYLICSGEGQMLHYLIGLWLRAAAIRGFGHVATNIHAPARALELILETVEEGLKSPDGIANSLRVDLSSLALTQLDRTIDDGKLPKIVDSLLEVYYRPRRDIAAKVPGSEHAAIADAWLDDLRERLLVLLDGHPRPFDKRATARLMGLITAETIQDLENVRRPAVLDVAGQLHSMRRKLRLFRLAQKTRHWPAELAPGVEIDVTGGMGLKPPDEEVVAIELPAESLSDALLKVARSKLRRVENPVGLMLTEQFMAFDYGPHLLRHLNSMKTMRRLMRRRIAAKGTIHGDD
jgi:hypothetical protein